MTVKSKTLARKVWDHIAKRKNPFTSNEVSKKTGVAVETVRHYLSFWKGKGAVEAAGKVEEIGKAGRPLVLWATVTKEFISVWR